MNKIIYYNKRSGVCSLYLEDVSVCEFRNCRVYKGRKTEKYYYIVDLNTFFTLTQLSKEEWKYVEI